MSRNNFWKWAVVISIVLWSLFQAYPPGNQDIAEVFNSNAINKNKDFEAIVSRYQAAQKTNSAKAFANLVDATGTNDLRTFFPQFDVRSETNPNFAILNRIQRLAAGKIKLGLDLQGGTSFLVTLDTNKLETLTDRQRALEQAIEVLRTRVDKFGVAEPVIQAAGADRILIQLPGLSEADKLSARAQITNAAFLEFRLVHPRSRELLSEEIVEPGYEILRESRKARDGSVSVATYLVAKKPAGGLTGKNLKKAFVARNQMSNDPEIHFELDAKGAEIFAQITRENVGNQLAIVLDGQLRSAPTINGEIPSGSGVITLGQGADVREAFELANVLENPLEAPVRIQQESSVDPSLGRDAIESGVKSALIGILAVSGFMIVYYLASGLVANVALVANVIILIGIMCAFETTFTLPGIAGIVLTIGMAVDANVLIYERIREESAKGKSLKGAIAAGYDRAFSTIFDSHVTTLISSVILIYMGTGSIKGFGVTLTIGVAVSLFTALVVTRLIFDFLLDRGWIKTLSMLHLIKSPKIDFMKLAKPAFTISWLVILIGLGFGFKAGKEMFGVDFRGGDTTTFSFAKKVDVEKIRASLANAGLREATIQYQSDLAGASETLRVTTASDTSEKVSAALTKEFADAKLVAVGADRVGATVGKEIQKTAIVASIFALFGILIYVAFRYEFSFAIGAVVAVIHDVLMTIGVYCMAHFVSGREFNATSVAAILTIIGFSINDTIVIFDRIREDLKLGARGSFKDLINQALNQTLSRTIITSGTVFLATMSLYAFGGGAINDFAFTFLTGIITGTYSSIYIASALVLWWHKGERPAAAAAVRMDTPVDVRA